MGFLYGFVGAILGSILGVAAEIFIFTVAEDGDDFGISLYLAFFGLVGPILGAIVGVASALLLRRYIKRNLAEERTRRNNILIVSGCVLIIPLLVAALLWGSEQYGNAPSDQQLLTNFYRNQKTFDTLAQMTQMDKSLARVDYNWTDPSDPRTIGITPVRIAQYRRLLESVGLHRGFEEGDHVVKFISFGQGSAMSSDTFKGYAYLTFPPKQPLTSLDGCQPDEKNGVEAYRHIEGCWYLYYEYLPG